MCGIIGQLAFGELSEEKEKTRQESMIFLGSELLQLTQERGKDATGVSLLFEDGNYMGLKMGIEPIEFIARFGKTEKEFGGFIKAWRRTKRKANVFLGHCRKSSRGDSINNNNNHPIKVGEIIGIHNGTLDNDDKIFENLKCKRDGDVDSEAIFRLLHHYTKNGTEPFTIEMMKEVAQRLDGTYAVLGMSGNNPYQVCGFRDRRPIDMALIRPLKLVVIASERKFIETALFRYNKLGNLYIPGAKFPTLKKGDVDYKVLQDDSAMVFDLRKKVTAKTDIEDLLDWDKVPRTIVKGYEKVTTTTTYNRKNTNTSKNTTNNTSAATSTTKKEDNKTAGFKPAAKSGDNKNDSTGKVWSKKAKKYVDGLDEKDVETSKTKGNVEVNVTNGTAEELKPADDDTDSGEGPFALDHDDKANTRTLAGAATINELPAAEVVVEAEVVDDDETTTVEVDVTVDADAVEKAEELMKEEEWFTSDAEVVEALEVKDEATLKDIPPTAMANRIKKYVMKTGIIKGYIARKEEEDEGSHDGRKNKSAAENIRNLKALVHMCENIMKFSGVGMRDAVVERAVIDLADGGHDLTAEALDRVFKPGDDRHSEIIPLIKKMVAKKK